MQTKSLALSFELLNLKRRANRLARRAEGTAGGSYRHWWPRYVILRRSRRCNLRRCRVFRWLLLRESSGAALLPLLLLHVVRRMQSWRHAGDQPTTRYQNSCGKLA